MALPKNSDIVPGFDAGRDPSLTINLERMPIEARCIKVHLSGRIDSYNSMNFLRSVDQLVDAGFRTIVFCCANLEHVTSTGIGAFSSIHEALLARRGTMYMTMMKPKVYEVFQLLGYSDFLNFCDGPAALTRIKRSLGGAVPDPGVFPLSFRCPGCSRKLKTAKPGKFVCGSCKTRLVVGGDGEARIWAGGEVLG